MPLWFLDTLSIQQLECDVNRRLFFENDGLKSNQGDKQSFFLHHPKCLQCFNQDTFVLSIKVITILFSLTHEMVLLYHTFFHADTLFSWL